MYCVAQHSEMQLHISGCWLHFFSTTVGISLHLWAGVGQEEQQGLSVAEDMRLGSPPETSKR